LLQSIQTQIQPLHVPSLPVSLETKKDDPVNHSTHPRPQLERPHWRDLGGAWQFAFDDANRWREPADVTFDREIIVPYAPESRRSGIHDEGFHPVVWYRTTLTLTDLEQPRDGSRLLLHFGAVDYETRVWVNGALVAEHRGGHTPFCADLTEAVLRSPTLEVPTLEITVRAEDDPHDLAKPRGKQDWLPRPHEIWYPRTTGIWQPVWLEVVPETRIDNLVWTPHLERWEIGLEARLKGPLTGGLSLRVRLFTEAGELADDRYGISNLEVSRRVALSDPGIDDYRNELLWSPSHPQLIGAEVELLRVMDGREIVVDRVRSYTAMRNVSLSAHRFLLNGRPYFLRMVLDQGYWRDGLMTATDDELRADVELTKQLGFNGARKHQKIENPRWLYWCDVLGLLVWEEMPSPYRFTTAAVDRLVTEWTAALERDRSHPCIVAWVPFNESWGVPDLPSNPAHRDLVRTLYHLTKTLDPTRPVIGNDGWEYVATDIVGIHDYEHDPEKLLSRYADLGAVKASIERLQPGGRALALEGFAFTDHPVVLSEFGGIALSRDPAERGWGYSRATDAEAFLTRYTTLLEAILECREGLAGFCYTQLTDTFQEQNGILFEDRTPKADLQQLYNATRGERNARDADTDPNPDPMGYSKRWLQRQQKDRRLV
jgi:beta-galactosidase/beta-glucuronidase